MILVQILLNASMNGFRRKIFDLWKKWCNWLEFRRDEMFYTEHDFQVDLENFEFNLKFHAEKI